MATAQQLIEAAYSRSVANDPGKLATDGELLGVINRIYQTLYALKAVSAPEQHLATAVLTFTGLVTNALPTDIIDIRGVDGLTGAVAAGAKINVIPIEEKARGWHLAPRVYRRGGVLVSVGGAGDPVNTDTVTLIHLDSPATLVALATSTDARFPVRFEELIIVEAAMYLSTKDPNRDPGEFSKLTAYRNMQIEAFFRLCGLSMTAMQTPHGGVIIQTLNNMIASMVKKSGA